MANKDEYVLCAGYYNVADDSVRIYRLLATNADRHSLLRTSSRNLISCKHFIFDMLSALFMYRVAQNSNSYTPPDNMQFLDNHVRLLYPNFLVYMGEILLQF